MAIRGDQRGQDMVAFAAGLAAPVATAISLGSSLSSELLLLIGP
ncbi:MAG: hypothetical protein NTZ72_04215 [Afipia sp.]|nr:hypothetical protein [Afipia sp.]